MKKIGLVGGTSWTSTVDYYTLVNEEMNLRLGGLQFAECILYSVNFHDYQHATATGDWEQCFELLGGAAVHLQDAGADMILLCANSAHVVAERISERVSMPLIDIRTVTAAAIRTAGLRKVGLIGTSYVMDMSFYRDKFHSHGIETIIPDNAADRAFIQDTLRFELGKGIIRPETKKVYLRIIDDLIAGGAQGIILGCTEIPLIISQKDVAVPVFNTTQLHAIAAVEYALTN